MHRNPKTVRDLEEQVSEKKQELQKLNEELREEKSLVPVGYELSWLVQV